MAMLSNAKKAAQKAAVARARMAKRAKRARFFKEHKKNLLLAFLGFLLIAFLAVFTPFGPDYYYSKIQAHKMESASMIRPGVFQELYNLGVFYNYSFRSSEAMKCYDEIGTLYFGFKISDYARHPEESFELRRQAEIKIKKGLSKGPPFEIAESDRLYVGLAIWRVGDLIGKTQSKQLVYRVYKDLYLDDLLEKYPSSCDEEVTNIVRGTADRIRGKR